MKRILVVEPYYGGSHKQFLAGLMESVSADYSLITLPARKWKMRMQLAAPWVVEQIKKERVVDRHYDTVLCSTFVDVGLLRALVSRVKGWNHNARFCIYLHENQFAYPSRINDPAYFQFTAINFNSCLAADSLAFNSCYNIETFLSGCRRYLKSATDMSLPDMTEILRAKSRVLYPGINFDEFPPFEKKETSTVPVIVWNHRWEHDKNPEEFFESLNILQMKNIKFRLVVLGQSFDESPQCFVKAEKQFAAEIMHFGFAQSYADYVQLLGKGNFVVSTANHEFFGIAVIEAVRAGCIPVLPKRLSYPELFEKRYLYSSGGLAARLEKLVKKDLRLSLENARKMTESFSWSALHKEYEDWLLGDVPVG